uniref:Phosphogluconate dehydratase (EC) n=1 Tax=Ganoderma boninense TaxID=34458 RepID=A0A5K1K4A7_9APHY|nr:Phosphogluconate dehydratase (EC [Ganoderma boninense]
MRFSLSIATGLAAAGLVRATREFTLILHVTVRPKMLNQTPPALEARRVARDWLTRPTMFVPVQLRTAGDTSHLQLGFWNLTYRGDLGALQLDLKTNYTTAVHGLGQRAGHLRRRWIRSSLTDIRDAALVA